MWRMVYSATSRLMRNLFPLLLILLLSMTAVLAQDDPTRWSLSFDDKARTASLKVEIDAGWKLYALDQPPGGPFATTIKVTDSTPFEVAGKIESPKPTVKPDPLFVGLDGKALITKYFTETAIFKIPLRATADSTRDNLSIDVRFQVCNDTFCLPPKTVRATIAGAQVVKSLFSDSEPKDASPSPAASNPPKGTNNQQPTDLWPFIWLAITLGALSLLTPCVFPMIPITVSYFTNHAAGNRAKSVKLALIYSLGIIATFTLLGMLLAIFVGAAGINLFAANPWINLLITAIFLFFAFNLFGAYEITIPTSVLTRLDRLTRSKEGEGSGIVGALLMGLTFTLTSFTCTSPFVGTILVSAAQGEWQMPLIGMLAFSSIFALPFFVLALAPQLVSHMPRAGGWMNSVKVAMGFLEVAAAMKFISNVDLVWKWGIFTRDVVLAVWIALGVVLALYLLGKFQLSHDSKPERLGALRMFSAVVTFAVTFYLLTGLFGAKLGELESFLPPDLGKSSSRLLGGSEDEPKWLINDYEGALAKAKSENKRVFVDFTGYTCTNCRWMEANIFPKPEVATELEKFVLVQLYTDGEGEVYVRQQQMEQDMFGTVALPFYAIMDGDGRPITTFAGLTRSAAEFVEFLKKGQ